MTKDKELDEVVPRRCKILPKHIKLQQDLSISPHVGKQYCISSSFLITRHKQHSNEQPTITRLSSITTSLFVHNLVEYIVLKQLGLPVALNALAISSQASVLQATIFASDHRSLTTAWCPTISVSTAIPSLEWRKPISAL